MCGACMADGPARSARPIGPPDRLYDIPPKPEGGLDSFGKVFEDESKRWFRFASDAAVSPEHGGNG